MRRAQSGFTLVELTTTLALIGVISAALMAVMTNLNTQSERMNSQTELLVASKQLFNFIEPWAALAGHKQATPALPQNKAYEIVSASHIKFCYDLDAATRDRCTARRPRPMPATHPSRPRHRLQRQRAQQPANCNQPPGCDQERVAHMERRRWFDEVVLRQFKCSRPCGKPA